jgi:hypothetical protein
LANNPWRPTTFLRYVETIGSSSLTAIVQTDAGRAYLKAINNPQSPHVLACDWIGTNLARRFGLQTFDVAILEIEDGDEIPLDQNTIAQIGPAFVTCEEKGEPLAGESSLRSVQNLGDIPRLVVFDTLVRNCDRHRPANEEEPRRINRDNLFLSEEGAEEGKFILKAIDHGHIFSCGRPLTRNLADIANVKDDRLYGLFPFFEEYVTTEEIARIALEELQNLRAEMWEDLLNSVPTAWQVSSDAKQAIGRLLLERARFLADNIESIAARFITDTHEEN